MDENRNQENVMNYAKMLAAGLLVMTPVFSALAATGCEAKRQSIEHELSYAIANGNSHRVGGLEKARSELNANCTEEGLRAERESDVRKKEHKVEELRQELAEAQAEGRQDKINKKGRKLSEAQAELDDAKNMIDK